MTEVWADTRRDVRAMHLEMFYRPILPVVARLSADEAGARRRGGRRAPCGGGLPGARSGAAPHRRAERRRLAPRPHPAPAAAGDDRLVRPGRGPRRGPTRVPSVERSAGRRAVVSSSCCATRARPPNASRGCSRRRVYAAKALLASEEAVTWLDDDSELEPRTRERLWTEADAILKRSNDRDQAITAVRGLRRRELLAHRGRRRARSHQPLRRHGRGHRHGRRARGERARVARHVVAEERGEDAMPERMIVVAMGRFGGNEMTYTSDADVQFVWDGGGEGAQASAVAVAVMVRQLLQTVGPQPPLAIDADLRPEGKNGPLARSLESCAEYYGRWSDPWEAQALLRARPSAGDEEPPRGIRRGDRPRSISRSRCLTARSSRCGRSRHAWNPSDCRAAWIRGATSSWAPAGCLTSSGRCSCCNCSTATRSRLCAPPRPSPRSRRRVTRS